MDLIDAFRPWTTRHILGQCTRLVGSCLAPDMLANIVSGHIRRSVSASQVVSDLRPWIACGHVVWTASGWLTTVRADP